MFESSSVYNNGLDWNAFSRILDDTTQCYKYYWLESILELSVSEYKDKIDSHSKLVPNFNCTDIEITFDELCNEMIYEAWFAVTHFHLKLGPANTRNYLELAVMGVAKTSKFRKQFPERKKIIDTVKRYSEAIRFEKEQLCVYVPYKLLSPFLRRKGLELGYRLTKSPNKLIDYLDSLNENVNMLYTFIRENPGESVLMRRIIVNRYWRQFLVHNYYEIKDWIQHNKARYLQARNIGVPDIMSKVSIPKSNTRDLESVLELWKLISRKKNYSIENVYSLEAQIIPDSKISIDHFIPKSYVSHDELWDLIPMEKSANSSKNNKLPQWQFFPRYAEKQFFLYEQVAPQYLSRADSEIIKVFRKCFAHNITSPESQMLYCKEYSYEEFIHKLESIVKPVYNSAALQGYEVWIP